MNTRLETLPPIVLMAEIEGETWRAEVSFARWFMGPMHDEAPAVVTRDGERVEGAKWANAMGGSDFGREAALVGNGCLWAPDVVGKRPRTLRALHHLTQLVQREVWAKLNATQAAAAEEAAVA